MTEFNPKPDQLIALFIQMDTNYMQFFFLYRWMSKTPTYIHFQVKKILSPFTSNRVAIAEGKLEELYKAIPFPDKER